MPPQARITKESILAAAVEIVRQKGENALNAREIAACLGCSTQPLFSNYESMEALKKDVLKEAEKICGLYVQKETESGLYPPYKAGGMGYIRFAREEKALFRMLYMRTRPQNNQAENSELNDRMILLAQQNTGMDEKNAGFFHLEIWAFVHGIAAMTATGYLELPDALISRMITDCFQGLKKQAAERGEDS